MSAAVCVFDRNRRHLAIATSDRRVRIIETTSNSVVHEFREANNTSAYTCIAWIPSSAKSTSLGSICLGCADGSIVCVELSTGEWRSNQSNSRPHSSKVTDITYSSTHNAIFSSAVDGSIQQLSWPQLAAVASRSATSQVEHIEMHNGHDDELVVADGTTLNIIDLGSSDYTVKQKLTGSSGNIEHFHQSKDGLVMCASSNDRFVPVWSFATDAKVKSKKTRKAATILSLPAVVNQARINQTSVQDGYQIAALVDRHSISVFSLPSGITGASATVQSSITLPAISASQATLQRQQQALAAEVRRQQANERANQSADGKRKRKNREAVMAASTSLDSETNAHTTESIVAFEFIDDRSLIVARGHHDRPQCYTVQFRSESGHFIETLQLPQTQNGLMRENGDESNKKRKTDPTTVLATSSAPLGIAAKLTSPLLSASPAQAPIGSPLLNGQLPLMQRTLAERLAEMQRHAGTFGGDSRVLAAGATQSSVSEINVPKAGSFQALLTQALHTNDDSLFEFCLQSGAPQSQKSSSVEFLSVPSSAQLEATLSRLPSTFVLPLLTKLTAMLRARPSRANLLLSWIQSLLLIQTPHLLALPSASLSSALSPLAELIDHRAASYKRMCRLQGKLELLRAQIAHSTQPKQAATATAISGPSKIFIESAGVMIDNESTAPTTTGKKNQKRTIVQSESDDESVDGDVDAMMSDNDSD